MMNLWWMGGLMLAFALEPSAKPVADAAQETKPVLHERMTVAAEKKETKAGDVTGSVTVIDAEDIEARMVRDTRDLVRYEPGVIVASDPTRLGINGFNIRGIGGNRVSTLVDGVRTGEQFEFGPLSVHQVTLDPQMVKSVEIVKSASSALYGSDALGGLVSFQTKNPLDFLSGDQRTAWKLKTTYDDKNQGGGVSFLYAAGDERRAWLASGSFGTHEAMANQGDVDTQDFNRTQPNDIDGQNRQILLKGLWGFSDHNRMQLSLEHYGSDVDTAAYSLQGDSVVFGVPRTTANATANDTQDRYSLILEHDLTNLDTAAADFFSWKAYARRNQTRQRTREEQLSSFAGAASHIEQLGTMDLDQDTMGFDIRLGKNFRLDRSEHFLAYGLSYETDHFEQVRDRTDNDLITGEQDVYAGTLILPTRYFPPSDLDRLGAYLQYEALLFDQRLKIAPGLRYDRHQLSPDENDLIYQESVGIAPKSMDEDVVSPKLGLRYNITEHAAVTAQYATGFRAPPHSAVNSGFTNLASGYATLPNPDLEPETSENLEFGIRIHNDRGSLNLTWFDNQFEDFIDLGFSGVDERGITLFQSQNIEDVDISGLELKGDWIFDGNVRLHVAYSQQEGENGETQTPLNQIPPARAVLGLEWSNNRVETHLYAVHVAEKSSDDLNDETLFAPDAYTTLDLTIGIQMSTGFDLRVGGFNLTDETYHPWPDVLGQSASSTTIDRYSAPGRSFSLALSLKK